MKNRNSSYIDQRLKQRVEEYLKSTNTQYVDVAEMAAEFQQQYRMDYGRRNKTAFRIQVEKVYKVICDESGISALEEKHLAKRARRSKEDEGEDRSVLSDSSDSEADFSENENTNHMNNSLMSLYCKGNPENRAGQKEQGNSSPNPAKKGSAAEGSSSSCTSNPTTTVSAGGWFIDKTGRKDQENILIDLSAESASSAGTKDTALSALEPEKKLKSKKKEKRKKQREGESKGVDADIEESVMAKKARTKPPELQHSTVKFEDVGGSEETLTELCKLLIHMRHPEVYQQLGVVPPRGFLLHGPPGCGKTLLAQAVAGEMELPILKVSAPELVSGILVESEQKLRELFEQAVSSAPCILFIDEIDAITPKREVASKDMERRIVCQLLTCMDDPALRRAGRFEREICLGIPDEGARIKILCTLCQKLKLAADFDFAQLARLTPGYVGADLMALCHEAAMTAVNRLLLRQNNVSTKSQDVSMSSDMAEDSEQASDHLSAKREATERLTACECFWTGEGLTAAPAAR
ncbi:nuclear valosin-containing protein-like [Tachysurus ichikawai]